MKVKLDKVCKRIYAGGDVPKDRYSTVMTSEYTVPIYANAEKDDGLYGYTDTARENELSITVAARGTIGFTAIRRKPFLPVVRLITVVPDLSKVSERYLYYALKNCKPASSGTSIPQLTVPDIKKNEIELYSLPVQEKIADKLDVVVRIIALRQQELQRLDDLVKARFVELFGAISEEVPLLYYIGSLNAGKSLAGEEENPNKVLKTGAVTYDCFDETQIKNLPIGYEPQENHRVKAGDVIISRMNTAELVGAAAYVWDVPEHIYLPDRLWRAEVKETANPIFVWQVLIQSSTKESIRRIASGTSGSMKNISKPGLLGIRVVKAPIELQKQFAAFVTQTDKSKLAISESLTELETLKNSLMQQYFG